MRLLPLSMMILLMFWDSPMLLCVFKVYSFLLVTSIPYRNIPNWFTHAPMMNIWVVSNLGLLWKKSVINMYEQIFLMIYVFTSLWQIPSRGIKDCMLNCQNIFHRYVPFYMLSSNIQISCLILTGSFVFFFIEL